VDVSNTQAVSQIEAIRRELNEYYSAVSSAVAVSAPPYLYFQRFVRLLSDIQFNIPTLWEARLKAQSGWPTYLFHFAYLDSMMLGQFPYPAVRHTNDYPYSVGRVFFGNKFNENSTASQAVRATVLNAIISFIKTGEPTAGWPRLNFPKTTPASCTGAMEGYKAAKISGDGLCVESGVRSCGENGWEQSAASRLDFWDRLSSRHDLRLVHSFPNTQGQCLPTQQNKDAGHSSCAVAQLSQIIITLFITILLYLPSLLLAV